MSVLPLSTLEQVRTFWIALHQHCVEFRSLEGVENTYQQSCRLTDVLFRRLAVVPTLVPLAIVVGDLVFIAGFDWCSGGNGGGRGEEEDFGELHGCLWNEVSILVCGCCSLGRMRWRCEMMAVKMRRDDRVIYPNPSVWMYTTTYTLS